MKFKTFYSIYYKHRISKANFFLKVYIFLILPLRFLYNLLFVPVKKNLDVLDQKDPILKKLDLSSLFDHFNSDKGNKFEDQYVQPSKRSKKRIKGHGYAKYYEKYFINLKAKPLNILEIGSFHGNASASLFFYFEKAKIYSGDIFPDLFRYKSQRIFNFYVDSSNEDSIREDIINKKIDYDIIIEDASHAFKDQIISLFLLFRILKSGGLFIVEELDFPDKRKDMNPNLEKPTLREIFNLINDNKNFGSKYIDDEDKKYFLSNYLSIEIFKGNFNEVAIIKKK